MTPKRAAAIKAIGERRLKQRRSYLSDEQRREVDRDVWLAGQNAAALVRLQNECNALRIIVKAQSRLLDIAEMRGPLSRSASDSPVLGSEGEGPRSFIEGEIHEEI